MPCRNNCVYLGYQHKPGIGLSPVCGFTSGPAIPIDDRRPICGEYKPGGAGSSQQDSQNAGVSTGRSGE